MVTTTKNDPELAAFLALVGSKNPASISFGESGEKREPLQLNTNRAAQAAQNKTELFDGLRRTLGDYGPGEIQRLSKQGGNILLPELAYRGEEMNLMPRTGPAVRISLDELMREAYGREQDFEAYVSPAPMRGEELDITYARPFDQGFPIHYKDNKIEKGFLVDNELYEAEREFLKTEMGKEIGDLIRQSARLIGADVLTVQVTIQDDGTVKIDNLHLDFSQLLMELNDPEIVSKMLAAKKAAGNKYR